MDTTTTIDSALRAAHYQRVEREGRAVSRIELREAGEDSPPTVFGYASTFDQWYEVHDAFGPYQERVASGAFTKTLQDRADVRLLVEHEGLPLARTSSGTLELRQDAIGLYYEAGLEATDPDVERILPKMRRGDLSDSSFAFRVIRQEWDEDYEERTILEVKLYDVSIVTFPANPNASAGLRGAELLEELAQIRTADLATELRAGRTDVATITRAIENLRELEGELGRSDDEPADPPAEEIEIEDPAVEATAGRSVAIARRRLELLELGR